MVGTQQLVRALAVALPKSAAHPNIGDVNDPGELTRNIPDEEIRHARHRRRWRIPHKLFERNFGKLGLVIRHYQPNLSTGSAIADQVLWFAVERVGQTLEEIKFDPLRLTSLEAADGRLTGVRKAAICFSIAASLERISFGVSWCSW